MLLYVAALVPIKMYSPMPYSALHLHLPSPVGWILLSDVPRISKSKVSDSFCRFSIFSIYLEFIRSILLLLEVAYHISVPHSREVKSVHYHLACSYMQEQQTIQTFVPSASSPKKSFWKWLNQESIIRLTVKLAQLNLVLICTSSFHEASLVSLAWNVSQ